MEKSRQQGLNCFAREVFDRIMGELTNVELVDSVGQVCQTQTFDLFDGHLQLTGRCGLLEVFKARTIKQRYGAVLTVGQDGLTGHCFTPGVPADCGGRDW